MLVTTGKHWKHGSLHAYCKSLMLHASCTVGTITKIWIVIIKCSIHTCKIILTVFFFFFAAKFFKNKRWVHVYVISNFC